MLLVVTVALARPLFSTPTEPVAVGDGGNWARVFPADDGWLAFFAAGGEFAVVTFDDALNRTSERRDLLGRNDTIDHAIARCPDGTWLHVASQQVDGHESAWAFRHDADSLEVVADADLGGIADPEAYHDMFVLCAPTVEGVGFGPRQPWFYTLDDDVEGTLVGVIPLADGTGSAMVWDERSASILAVSHNFEPELYGYSFDTAMTLLSSTRVAAQGEADKAYWSQGLMTVGAHRLVAYMASPLEEVYLYQGGNVWVAAYDDEWNLVDQVQVTHYDPPDGAMRPFITLKGDQLAVSWDYESTPYFATLTLDVEALEEDPTPDTGDSGDSGDSGDDSGDSGDDSGDDSGGPDSEDTDGPADDPSACGCAAPPAPHAGRWSGALPLFLILARSVVLRRPSRRVTRG